MKSLKFAPILIFITLSFFAGTSHADDFSVVLKPAPKKNKSKVAKTHKHFNSLAVQALGNDIKMVNVLSFTSRGSVYQMAFPGLLLSEKQIAIRLDPTVSLEDIVVHSRLFVRAPGYVQYYPVEIDFASRLILLQTEQLGNDPNKAAQLTGSKVRPYLATKLMGYDDSRLLNRDVDRLKLRFQAQRNISSLQVPSSQIFENRIQNSSDQIADAVRKSKSKIKIDDATLIARFEGLHCRTASPRVASEPLQKSILGAVAVDCSSDLNVSVSSGVEFGLKAQAGLLTLREQNPTVSTRSMLLQNLASREFEQMQKLSAQVEDSTPTACESTHLSDKNIDVYFCTRNLRGFKGLTDSFVVMGRLSGRNYIYSLTKTAGFSAVSTRSIIQSNLETLAVNP